MTTLNLGVVEVPYSWGQKRTGGVSAAKAIQIAKRVAAGKEIPPTAGGVTTYDVALWLEAQYGLMQAFVNMKDKEITAVVENSLQGVLETTQSGGPDRRVRALAAAAREIEQMFRNALSAREFDGKIAGVPTMAAMRGISHRTRRPHVRRAPRPSFIDTGLYQRSFRVWIT